MAQPFLLRAFFSVTLVCNTAVAGARVIYVDAGATGPLHNGTTWCQGVSNLQDGLLLSVPGDVLLVAGGTYTPDRGIGTIPKDRSASFLLRRGVTIVGGFAGCGAADPDARDPASYETILSGDLDSDDEPGFVNIDDNSYHVVTSGFLNTNPVLDGLTISGGNADGPDPELRGGGLYNVGGSPTIRNCTFRRNRAHLGGAINNEGGGPKIEHCVFAGNAAGFSGGAIRGWNALIDVTNCLFVANTAEAGGAAWHGASTVSLRNCTFVANTSPLGNALSFGSCCPQQPSLLFGTNCIFFDGGDEVYNEDASSVFITFSRIDGTFAGAGNIDDDPLFVPGPAGCFYLSHTTAGQPAISPCVSTGSGSALSQGLAVLTTRSDEAGDLGTVDMGYHYPITGKPLIPGDYDRNLVLDLHDAAAMQRCFTGQGPTDVPPCCRIFDAALDNDVNLEDTLSFTSSMTGP